MGRLIFSWSLLESLKVFYIWDKSQYIDYLFYYILHYSFLLPPFAYLIFFRKIGLDKKILTLVYYCVSIFLYLFLQYLLPRTIQNPLFTLLEFTFFATLVFQQLKLKKQKMLLIMLSLIFFFYQAFYFFSSHKERYDSIPIGVEAILVFIFIFFFLYEQIKDAKDLPIYDNYFFWISIGLFIYLGGSFFIYLSANILSSKEIMKYWFFTYIVEIIKNLLFSVAILMYSKNPNNRKSNQVIPNLDFML